MCLAQSRSAMSAVTMPSCCFETTAHVGSKVVFVSEIDAVHHVRQSEMCNAHVTPAWIALSRFRISAACASAVMSQLLLVGVSGCVNPVMSGSQEWESRHTRMIPGQMCMLGNWCTMMVVLQATLRFSSSLCPIFASTLVVNSDLMVLQAHAWTALGKVCLSDEGLAKKCLPLFVQQLHRAACPAVRPAPFL